MFPKRQMSNDSFAGLSELDMTFTPIVFLEFIGDALAGLIALSRPGTLNPERAKTNGFGADCKHRYWEMEGKRNRLGSNRQRPHCCRSR